MTNDEPKLITQTEHRRLTAEVDDVGVEIRETIFDGTRAPSEVVCLTKAEFAKIARLVAKTPAAPSTKRQRNGGQRGQTPKNTPPPRQ